MKLCKEINILEDKEVYNCIIKISMWLLAGTATAVGVGVVIRDGGWNLSLEGRGLLWFIGLYLLSLPVHELIHGFFFRIFSKSGKIKFGFQQGMLYAGNPGEMYTKGHFSMIILAPFFLNTLFFFLLSKAGVNELALWGVFVLHTSGCVGDFWYIYELIKHPTVTHCEDTPVGIKLYCPESSK